MTTLREERWKYVRGEEGEELYDLDADPHELVNVSGSQPAQTARMRAALDAMLADLRERGQLHAAMRADAGTGGEVDPELLRELGELGYGGEEDE